MSDGLSAISERVRQDRTSRIARANQRLVETAEITRRGGRMFLAGDRVFDTVSGLEGEVIHGARENIIVSPAE